MKPTHHILGVRHHGPGSARHLQKALAALQPDMLLVEGPPDANPTLHWLAHAEMEPPVALLVYQPDKPQDGVYFPFAPFSPEFQAVQHGYAQQIPVRFMDLPQKHMMALGIPPLPPAGELLQQMARAAGYAHYETWWHNLIEQRFGDETVFPAIQEMMIALREEATAVKKPPANEKEAASYHAAEQREAFMRNAIRRAYAEGFQRIAVVCGAWHGPALRNLQNETTDHALITGLPEVTIETAWLPWTYSRLHARSGYGAGIQSPGWYHHLWEMGSSGATAREISVAWLTKVAALLRGEDLDASAAHVIEAVRLAEALASLRGQPFPGLDALNEATQTILCFGDAAPLHLIERKLSVSERMGAVPGDMPLTPLQKDVYAGQKQLALPVSAEKNNLELDLRREEDLKRSHFLHRLRLLGVTWGQTQRRRGRQGTYQELWQLQWQPSFTTQLIEASAWGNTLPDAAEGKAKDSADHAADLAALTTLLDQIILAGLSPVIPHLMQRVEDEAARSSDIPRMMGALPPLAHVLRYGDVRGTDRGMIEQVVDGLLTRICIGLPTTCAALDDKAAEEILTHLNEVQHVVETLHEEAYRERWQEALQTIADQTPTTALLAGRACRLLFSTGSFAGDAVHERMSRALLRGHNLAQEAAQLAEMAAWLDGFLRGSGLLLVHDRTLWQLLDQWVLTLDEEGFVTVLPLLRRTFATFTQGTRLQLAEQVQHGGIETAPGEVTAVPFNPAQAEKVLPTLRALFLPTNEEFRDGE